MTLNITMTFAGIVNDFFFLSTHDIQSILMKSYELGFIILGILTYDIYLLSYLFEALLNFFLVSVGQFTTCSSLFFHNVLANRFLFSLCSTDKGVLRYYEIACFYLYFKTKCNC